MIDRERVGKHLDDLSGRVARLERLRSHSYDELKESMDNLAIAERNFHLAIQNVLDLGAHILSGAGLNDFEEYKEIPQKLARHGVITQELGARLADLAGFRNILVHAYLVVRADLVYEKLQNCLDDFRDFAGAIESFLSRQPEEPP